MSDHIKYCTVSTESSVEINTEDCIDSCENINIEEKNGDELLIELYRERPFLYDKSNINFKDCLMKQNAWLEISNIMIQICGDMYTPLYCQKRCTSLRDQYNREKRNAEIESKSGSAATKATRFPFFAQLAFLDRFIQRRRSYTNYTKSQLITVDEDSNESQSATNALTSEENKSVNEQLNKSKRTNKENIAPKIKKWKVDDTKELEQSLIQMNHRISTYMEKKATADDVFMDFIKVQFNNVPEQEKNIRRKMIMDVFTAPLQEM